MHKIMTTATTATAAPTRRATTKAPRQLSLDFPRRGRPRGRNVQDHLTRPDIPARHPLHLTLKLVDIVQGSLRLVEVRRAVDGVLAALHRKRHDFRVIAYSIQHNHLHLMVEAEGPGAFRSGV